MGRSEGGSSAGAIAVVVIGGVLLLAILGCGGVAAIGFLFFARLGGAPQVNQPPASIAPSMPVTAEAVDSPSPPLRVITNNVEGQAVIDGVAYSDDELRQKLAEGVAAGITVSSMVVDLTPEISPQRRADIELIVAQAGRAESPLSPIVNPQEATP